MSTERMSPERKAYLMSLSDPGRSVPVLDRHPAPSSGMSEGRRQELLSYSTLAPPARTSIAEPDPGPPTPTPRASVWGPAPTPPEPPTESESSAFVQWIASGNARVTSQQIEAILSRIDTLLGQASPARSDNWCERIRDLIGRRVRLESLQAALASGAYRAPSSSEIAREQGRAIAEKSLATEIGIAGLIRSARFKRDAVARDLSAREHDLASLGSGAISNPEELSERYTASTRAIRGLRAELEALASVDSVLPAIGAIVARAIEQSGGQDAVVRDLVDSMILAGTSVPSVPGAADAEDRESAEIETQLLSLGGADSPGRVADSLRARLESLRAARAAREDQGRTERRRRAIDEARAIVDRARSGDVGSVRKLTSAVLSTPGAFHQDLGRSLKGAPMEAFETSGSLAGIATLNL